MEETIIALRLEPLPQAYVKGWAHDEATLTQYQQVVEQGCSVSAYEDRELIGLALAEPRAWNRMLWVEEFHVSEGYRRRGIGAQMMAALVEKAKGSGLRAVAIETQNTNVPAIRFYRKMGFEIDGVDLSLYTNHDMADGEAAIFMKRKL